jgi:hypothetical protein
MVDDRPEIFIGVAIQLRYDDRTKAYLQHRVEEGLTKTEVICCLKRYVAREVFAILHYLGKQNIA